MAVQRSRRDRDRRAAADDRLLEPAGRNGATSCAITSMDGVTPRWLHTGDLGYLDEDGYLFIVDRKKDLIKTSGYQVWPREIEEVIAAHPAVAEVGVAGVPDATKGEIVKAWVVLRAGTDGVRGGSSRVLPRDAGALQSAGEDRVSGRPAEDDGRKGAPAGAQGRRVDRMGRMGGMGRTGRMGSDGLDRQDRRRRSSCRSRCSRRTSRADVDRYEVYAVRFATLANFPVSSLVAGADRSRRMDIAMMIWVLKGVDGRDRDRRLRLPSRAVLHPVHGEGLHQAVRGDRAARHQAGGRHRSSADAHALGPRRRHRSVSEGARLGAEGRVRLLHRRSLAVAAHPRRHRRGRCAGDREAQHGGQGVVRARRRRHVAVRD